MKKIILVVLIFFLFSSFVTKEVWAVTKTSGDLEVTFDEPIFSSSTVWYPGLIVGKSMTVKNKGSDSQTVSIEAVNKTQTGNFATVLFFKVLEWGIDRYGGSNNKTLQNFWDDGQVSLSSLAGGSTVVYDLTVTMDTAADNAYQGKEAKFDLQVGFVGTTSQVTVSGGGIGGGGGGGGPASPCTPPEAPKTPTLLSAVAISGGEVKLTWTKTDRATHYAIAYGISSGNYIYGNPNVGNTDSYTVGGLESGRTYYFVVSAAIGGDCPVASPYSNEVSSRFAGGTSVLGVETDPPPENEDPQGELTNGISTQAGEVAGTESKGVCPFWWIVLIGQTIALGIFYALNLRRKEWMKRWWIVTAATILLAYLIDRYAHTHWFVPSKMCPWEKWIGIILAGAETIVFKRFQKAS